MSACGVCWKFYSETNTLSRNKILHAHIPLIIPLYLYVCWYEWMRIIIFSDVFFELELNFPQNYLPQPIRIVTPRFILWLLLQHGKSFANKVKLRKKTGHFFKYIFLKNFSFVKLFCVRIQRRLLAHTVGELTRFSKSTNQAFRLCVEASLSEDVSSRGIPQLVHTLAMNVHRQINFIKWSWSVLWDQNPYCSTEIYWHWK